MAADRPPLIAASEATGRASISTRVWIDVALFVGYLLLSAPQTTGIPFHEYVTVVFIPIFIAHIVLDWTWVARVFRSTETKPAETRFNRLFDLVLFAAMVVVIYSGFMVSESILPDFGIEPTATTFWSTLHNAGGNLLILLVGVHLAMHWPWIKRNIGRIRPGSVTR
jgi:cytochrome b subunit of formate dehydrogenase